jgi:putative DNA methylase
MSDTAITPDYVKSNGRAGKMGQTLIAIVAEGNRSRAYVAPTERTKRWLWLQSPNGNQKPACRTIPAISGPWTTA